MIMTTIKQSGLLIVALSSLLLSLDPASAQDEEYFCCMEDNPASDSCEFSTCEGFPVLDPSECTTPFYEDAWGTACCEAGTDPIACLEGDGGGGGGGGGGDSIWFTCCDKKVDGMNICQDCDMENPVDDPTECTTLFYEDKEMTFCDTVSGAKNGGSDGNGNKKDHYYCCGEDEEDPDVLFCKEPTCDFENPVTNPSMCSTDFYENKNYVCMSNDGGAFDDPHIRTWRGNWYDYMGECDMILVRAPRFARRKRLQINIRTKIRYEYSFIETAVIMIGGETFELASYGQYFLNGVENAELPATISGYPLVHTLDKKKRHEFVIQIAANETITMKTFKDMVSVDIKGANPERFQHSYGMMGGFDEEGKLIGRDRKTLFTDPNKFALEWQVRNTEPLLFQNAEGVQHPQECILPDKKTAEGRARRLGESKITRAAAEQACAHHSQDTREMCIFDVMATGDLDLAEAN